MNRWEKGFGLLMMNVRRRTVKAKEPARRGRPAKVKTAFDHSALAGALGNLARA